MLPPWAGLAVLVTAGLLETYGDQPVEDVFVFGVATLGSFALFSWLTGHAAGRLELAPTVLVAEALVYLAAVATAVAITWDPAWGVSDRTREGTEPAGTTESAEAMETTETADARQ